jgi:hypothetical protein
LTAKHKTDPAPDENRTTDVLDALAAAGTFPANDEPEEITEPVQKEESPQPWVYIGPTVQRSQLQEGRIVTGTRADVEKFFAPELEKHPKARHLIVTASNLGACRESLRTSGNLLSKTYADMKSAIKT